MIEKIKAFILDLQLKLMIALQTTKRQLADVRGDTNFISIAIILIVVIGLAIVFITLGDTITGWVNQKVEELRGALGM